MNNATRDSAIRLDIANNSPAGFNDLEVATVTFKIMNSDLSAALTPTQARNLFNAVMLVRDSTSSGTSGVYESGIDVSTIAYLPMASINPDATGVSTLTVLFPDLQSAAIPAASPEFSIENQGGLDLIRITPNWPELRSPAGETQ